MTIGLRIWKHCERNEVMKGSGNVGRVVLSVKGLGTKCCRRYRGKIEAPRRPCIARNQLTAMLVNYLPYSILY